jgi:hypothetical protein
MSGELLIGPNIYRGGGAVPSKQNAISFKEIVEKLKNILID